MVSVLGNATKDNTRFTIFENDQVLTADQLNDLFNFLDVQTRLTRTRAIGVGIICGLEIGLLEKKIIVVEKGSAISTDGDLLHFPADQAFTHYRRFEDAVAKYPFFRKENDTVIDLYEMIAEKSARSDDKKIESFEGDTGRALKDFVGILYLEDHLHDPDLCTGTDCDNKGFEFIRLLKVLLAHKDDVTLLLKTIPPINKNYFALDDIFVPRVMFNKNISKSEELNGAFKAALSIKEELKTKITKAYQVCRPMVDDEFSGADPTEEWKNLLDEHFKNGDSIYAQYVYDFSRDLAAAHNELRETLFGDNMICCPDVQLFPKHVLMGLVKTASLNQPVQPTVTGAIPALTALPAGITATAAGSTFASLIERRSLLTLFRPLRFDITSLIRRYHTVHIDIDFRHHFYESPILNNKEENVQKTRFCFMRINSLIRNFKIPTSTDLQSVQGIRITPGVFEDKPLGERTIPFYYKFDRNLPVHLYWSYDANIRKKEDELLYYSSFIYTSNPATARPLDFNLHPYNFYRVEGHIGFKYTEVEAALNRIIDEKNLPINIISVQIEKNIRTVRPRPWFFPHLNIYEHFVKNSFLEHLNQAEAVNKNMHDKIDDPALKNTVKLAADSFSNAKTKVMSYKAFAAEGFDTDAYKTDVNKTINAATALKANTKQLGFSNTASPHDFILNTDIHLKAELLADLFKQQVDKKKEDLLLGNFMKNNPGLEHAGGVLRGGTFVLVYTSNDDSVVADFMLPYASVDKDVVLNPPTVKPLPLPVKPKFDFDNVFELKPFYNTVIENKVKGFDDRFTVFDDRIKGFDTRFNEKINVFDERIKGVDTRTNEKLNVFDERIKGADIKFTNVETKLNGIDRKVDDKTGLLDSMINDRISVVDEKVKGQNLVIENVIKLRGAGGGGTVSPGGRGPVVVAGVNLAENHETVKRLSREVETLQPNTPERIAKETQLAEVAKKITDALNTPGVAIDKDDEAVVKSILFDTNAATDKISSSANLNVRRTTETTLRNLGTNIGRIIR